MREIKFRAWDKREKKFSKNVAITENGHPYILRGSEKLNKIINQFYKKKGDNLGGSYNDIDFSDWYAIDNIEIQQFTSLLDKNGKEIYEGDVLQQGEEKQIIEFSSDKYADSGGQSYYVSYHWGYHLYSQNYIVFNPEQCKVIGNVHENPELLK